MNNRNLVRNIKLLLAFFSVCFLGIIVYLTYFSFYKSNSVAKNVANPRIREEEENVLRGSILDRDGNKIAYSQKTEDGKQKRMYKDGEAFAHILGYSSYVYGKTGIELAYNDILQGKGYGGDILQVIFQGVKSGFSSNEREGYDVYLSIDKEAQDAAYKMLGDDRGAVAAINTKTGEILAMVSKPSFNPGLIDTKFDVYNSDVKGTPFVNRAAQGYYAPGSVFKIVTAAAVLEENPKISEETFNCAGGLKIGTYTLTEQGGAKHGKVTLNK
ncbi:MAG: penicillin-binding protein 2, partial [Clostridiales bacterium]|nr:penicillin-binding protein 2 [Clostridiales bacterium]